MRKDIEIKEVIDIAIAIIPRAEGEEDGDYFWDAWLINLKQQPIKSVLVNSTGYGERAGEQVKTSSMRYFWEVLEPGAFVKIEPVQVELFDLANEFWLSFSLDDYLFDKKFVFTPGTLDAINFTKVPLINRQGVLIR
jgi:hypothetical protein